MERKCPYCGQTLHYVAFKCTRCNKWVDNEVFNRLCEDDVKLIKGKDLIPFTPALLAMMIIAMLKEDDLAEHDMQRRWGKRIDMIERFSLLAFNSFCFFKAASFAKMKQGCKDIIKETLKAALLQGIAELFNERVKPAPSLDILVDRGSFLYAKFEAVLHELGTNASSQLKASNAFGAIVFKDNTPISFTGLSLYTLFMETFKNMEKEFSKMFLIEEEDFDWKAVLHR